MSDTEKLCLETLYDLREDRLNLHDGFVLNIDDGAVINLDGAPVTFSTDGLSIQEAAYLAGVTAGEAAGSKAVVLDASKDIATIRNVTISGSLINGAVSLDATDLAKIDGITNGVVVANKAVVVDANKDAGDFRNVKVLGLDFECGATDVTFRVGEGKLIVSNLPEADPEVAGALFSDGGVLTISAGV